MSTNQKPLSPKTYKHYAKKGADAVLSANDLKRVAGFMDVLIQMDVAQRKRNARKVNDESDIQTNPEGAA